MIRYARVHPQSPYPELASTMSSSSLSTQEAHELSNLIRWIDSPPPSTPIDAVFLRQSTYLSRTQFTETLLRHGLRYAIRKYNAADARFVRYVDICHTQWEDEIDTDAYTERYEVLESAFDNQVGVLAYLSNAGSYAEMAMDAEVIDTAEWRRMISVAAHAAWQLDRLSDGLARVMAIAQGDR